MSLLVTYIVTAELWDSPAGPPAEVFQLIIPVLIWASWATVEVAVTLKI